MRNIADVLSKFYRELQNDQDNRRQTGNLSKRLENIYDNIFDKKYEAAEVVGVLVAVSQARDLPLPLELLKLIFENEYSEEDVIEQKRFQNGEQRDHFYHTMHLFALGDYLVESCGKLRSELEENYRGKDIHALWAMCALSHDIGYFICLADGLKERAIARISEILFEEEFIVTCVLGSAQGEYKFQKDFYSARLSEMVLACRTTIRKRFGEPSSNVTNMSLPGVRVDAGTGEGLLNYLQLAKSDDHGEVSAALLEMCRDIAREGQKHIEKYEGKIDLWESATDIIEAVEKHVRIGKGQSDYLAQERNPWIHFLHLLDEMQEYERPPVDPASRDVEYLRLKDVHLSATNEEFQFVFPLKYCEGITGKISDTTLGHAKEWGISIGNS